MLFLMRMTFRQFADRPLRALLMFFSVTLGVASVTAVRITVETAQESFKGLARVGTGSATLEIVSDQGRSFEDAVLDRISSVPGVTAAVPVLQRNTTLRSRGRAVALVVVGLDLAHPASLADYDLREGRSITGDGEVLLEVGLAHSLGIPLGEEVKLTTRGGLEPCTVVGLLAPRNVGASQGGFVFASLPEVQEWFREKGRVNSIQLQLAADAATEQVQAGLKEVLPPGLSVRVPAARSWTEGETLKPSLQALSFCSALAFVLAVFIILNSFLMNVSERRRLLSMMRAVGATRAQIVQLLLGEALLLGALGTLLGCGLGLVAARLLRGILEQLIWGTLPPLHVTGTPFVLAAALGPGVSLLSAYLPARRAGRISPLEGIGGPLPDEKPPAVHWYTWGGLTLGAAAVAVVTGCVWAWLPVAAAIPGAVLMTVAAVLLLPALLPLLERGVAAATVPLLGFAARLAHLTVLRYQVRSALTAGVLFVALSTGFAIGNTLTNNVEDIRRWCRRTSVCDYLIRAYRPSVSQESAADIPPGLEEQVRRLPTVTSLEPVRLVQVQAANVPSTLIIREFATPHDLHMDLLKGQPEEVYRGLQEGDVVLSTMLAQRAQLSVNDTFEVETPTKQCRLRVAGVCPDYLLGGLSVYIERAAARRLLGIEGSDAFLIRTDPAAADQTHGQLQALAEENGLLLQSFTDYSQMIDQMMNGAIGTIWGVIALGFLVASLAIANTLSMNVVEQTREIGLMRAAGMTRGQVYRMVLFQGLQLALVSLPPGALAGCLLAWLISLCLLPLTGQAVPFTLRLSVLAECAGGALGIVLLAASFQAVRASRLPVIEAIHTE